MSIERSMLNERMETSVKRNKKLKMVMSQPHISEIVKQNLQRNIFIVYAQDMICNMYKNPKAHPSFTAFWFS